MKKLLNTLYAMSEDIYLSLDGENVVANRDKQELARYPLHTLQSIISFSYAGLSPALMGECANRGIGVALCSPRGRFLARVCGEINGNVLLRREQYRTADDEAGSCRIARCMIFGKLYNSRRSIERTKRDHGMRVDGEALSNASVQIKELLPKVLDETSLDGLRGLERISELLGRLGDPQKELRYVHVAGTNGKGSISAMLASVLKKAELTVGLYTSPYVNRFNERMQINCKPIEDSEVAQLVEEIKLHADAMDDHPTEFEMMTAVAFLWFSRRKCDIVVLEVGLGGRLDATNVISCPDCCVITNIGLDHTAVLGSTLEKIACEKAGIIKEGCSVVMYQQFSEVMEVIRDVCYERNAELTVPDFDDISPEFNSRDGQVFSYGGEAYAIPLLGEHQLKNAATVLETVNVLRKQGWQIEHDAVEAGLYAVNWPARFEIVHSEPWFVVDGGHNPQCAQALSASLREYFPDDRRVLLMGVLRDKDYVGIVKTLAPLFDAFVTVTPETPRALPGEKLAKLFAEYGKEVQVCASIEEGVRTAMDIADELEGMVCACGSLYICGNIRACFGLR